MSMLIVTESGRIKELPDRIESGRVRGLDEDGRIVVGMSEDGTEAPFLFGLTLCCNASDKGVENGIVCRGCYNDIDTGNYLWRDEESGEYYGLDPVARIEPL